MKLTVWESLLGPDEFIKKAGEKFTAEHPNITIEFVNVELGDASKQIPLDGPAGKGPDVFAAPHDALGDLVSGGHVLGVTDAEALKKNVIASTVTADTWTDGAVYSYPVAAETYAIFCNKALVQEVPKTFDDLMAFGQEFNAANPGKYAFVMDVGNFYYTFPFMTKGGNRLFGSDGLDEKSPNLDTAESVASFTDFQKLREILPVAAADLATDAVDGLFASMGAYVLSRFTFPFKQSFLMSLLILNVFPSFVGMVAIYVVLLRIGGLDQLWGLVLVYLAGNLPYTTWMVKSYLDNIPRSLDEAARLDGASSFRSYRSIILPVARPILVFLTITSFTLPWMDFIFPKMVLRSPEKQTIALGLMSFVSDKHNFFTNFAAGALVVAIPFIIFFVLTQKMLVSSLAGSAVKE